MNSASERPRWSWRKKLLLQLALLPLIVLAAEGGYRLLLAAQGDAWSTAAAASRANEIVSPMFETIPRAGAENDLPAPEGSQHMAHPYWAFEEAQAMKNLAGETAEFRRGIAPEEFRILILGGSVAGIFGAEASELLAKELEKSPRLAGRKIRIVCHGRGAFKQPQQLNLLNFLLAEGHRYDAVLCIDGFNDVAIANQNAWRGANPAYPSVFLWANVARGMDLGAEELDLLTQGWNARREAAALLERANDRGLFHSAILGRRTLAQLNSIRERWSVAQTDYGKRLVAGERAHVSRGPRWNSSKNPHGELDEVISIAVGAWAESSRSQQAICSARKVAYLHVLQPTAHDEGAKVLTQEEIEKSNGEDSWTEAVKLGYPMLREAGAALKKDGVHFLDASMLFKDVSETLYFDSCHFTKPGCEMLALAIAPAFIDAIERAAAH